MKASSPSAFVRDATGLVKQFSVVDMLLIAAALVFSLQAVEVEFPWFYGYEPGANLTLALLIAATPFIFLMVVYWAAGVIMPRSGSDYLWVGRVFNPAVGFAWSMYYLLALFGAGYAASAVAVAYGASSSISIVALLFHSPSLVSTANWLGTPTGEFLISLLMTLGFATIAITGQRGIKGILYVGWVFAITGIGLMWYFLSVTNATTFASKWDSVLSSYTTYNGVISAASHAGFVLPASSLSATVVSIPIAVLFLLGGNYISSMSGEVKKANRAIPIALLLSLFLGIGFWAVSSTLTLNAVGGDWMRSIGYLFDNNAAAYSSILPFQPSMPMLLSVIAYPNQFLLGLIAVAFVLGSFPTLFFYFWIPSRYFFAWSFDRIIPAKMSDVNDRFHTPHYSILGITAVSIVYLYLFNFTSWSSAFALSTLIWFSAFILPSLAVGLVPYLKKDIFALAPAFFKRTVVGVPVLTIIGLVSAVSFSAMVVLSLSNPLLAVVNTFGAMVTLGVVALALVIYFASLTYHRRHGLDIRIAFKEIPPE